MYANQQALGRNWMTADAAQVVHFSDCHRCELRWNDGAFAYELFDTAEEAQQNMVRLGWKVAA